MFSINLLEEAGTSAGSIWIPILVLGWFLVMTIVGWQVSRRNAPAAGPSPSGSNPSELDHH
jgi:TRAP-type C4-dicarboxylate transport system permease small subunit